MTETAEKKVSYIDMDKRIIVGKSGTIYKIAPEDISVGRWPKYEIWSAMVATRQDFDTYISTLNQVIKQMTSAKGLGDMIEPYMKLKEIRDGAINFAQTSRSQLVEFASLFCLKTDNNGNVIEDIEDLTTAQIEEKFNDWKAIKQEDFFLLVYKVIPGYIPFYKSMHQQSEAESMTEAT